MFAKSSISHVMRYATITVKPVLRGPHGKRRAVQVQFFRPRLLQEILVFNRNSINIESVTVYLNRFTSYTSLFMEIRYFSVIDLSRECYLAVPLRPFIIWLQKYAHSDWLLSGHYFLVMTGHYEFFSRLDGSFAL